MAQVDRSEGDGESNGADETKWWHVILALLMVAAAVSGLYKLIAAVDPGKMQARTDAGFFDLLISDRTVLTILRVALILGVLYLVWSLFMLVRDKRFLTALPGVSVSAAQEAQAVGEEAVTEQKALEEALARANADIESLVGYIVDLQDQLEKGHDAADDLDEDDPPEGQPLTETG
jgi:hypothetical protein